MCMHYNVIGGTSNPINKVQMEMRKKRCQWKLGLEFLEPLGLKLVHVMTSHALWCAYWEIG